LGTKSVKRSGIKSGVTTSSAAPVSEKFLTVQSIAPPPNSIVPALRTRFRVAMRFSLMVRKIRFHLLRFRNQATAYFKLGHQGSKQAGTDDTTAGLAHAVIQYISSILSDIFFTMKLFQLDAAKAV